MLLSQMPNLYIVNHPEKGRGVFCTDDIPVGAVIEICPVVVIPKHDVQSIHKSRLHDYYFLWDEAVGSIAIALGYGSLYNHAGVPNAETESLIESGEIIFRAVKAIPAGTEITIDYMGGGKDVADGVWFDVVD